MDRELRMRLLRRLHGELTAAEGRKLDELLAADPEVRAEFERMDANWRRLEAPETPAAPAGFADAVLREARSQVDADRPAAWPAAARWAAPALTAVGIAGGVWLGGWAAEVAAEAAFPSAPESLAEAYVELLTDDMTNLEEPDLEKEGR